MSLGVETAAVKLVAAFLLSSLAGSASAAPFVRLYDFGASGSVDALAASPSDGLYLATRDGQLRVGMAAVDSGGRVRWSVQEDVQDVSRIGRLVATPDGVALLQMEASVVVRRLDDGRLVWRRRLVTPTGTGMHATAIAALPDGGILVGGTVDDDAAAPCNPADPDQSPCDDAGLVRLDADGRVTWAFALDTSAHEQAQALLPLPGGDFLVGSWRDAGNPPLDHDSVLSRHAGDGSLLWAVRLPVPGCGSLDRPGIRDLALLPDGDVVASGGGPSCGSDLRWLARLSPAGDLRWMRRENVASGPDGFGFGEVEPLDDGRVAVVSRSTVAVYDGSGALAWARSFVPPSDSWTRHAGLAVLAGNDVAAAWLGHDVIARLSSEGMTGASPCAVPGTPAPTGGLVGATVAPAAAFLRIAEVQAVTERVPELAPCLDPACHEACGVAPEVVLTVRRSAADVVLHLSAAAPSTSLERSAGTARTFAPLATIDGSEHVDRDVATDGRLLFYSVP